MLSNWGRRVGKKLMKPRLKPDVPPENPQKKWNIVRGDMVQVMEGPHVGQRGRITAVLRSNCRVVVDGVNIRNRNVKPKGDGAPGRKVARPCSIHYSNVMLIDPTIK